MFPTLKARGGQWWHISEREGRRLYLSKARLGEFVYEVIKHGGEVHHLWPFNAHFDRSPVYPVVAMTPAQRDELERATGFKLVPPPTIKLNAARTPPGDPT